MLLASGRGALLAAAACLAAACAAVPPLSPLSAPSAPPSSPGAPLPPSPGQRFGIHDLLTAPGPVPGPTLGLLTGGEVRRDRTRAQGGQVIREVVFSLRLGVDDYMVLRRSLVEGAAERDFLFALFRLEGSRITLQKAWRDEEGGGTFRPAPLEKGLLPLLGVPGGWVRTPGSAPPPPAPMELSHLVEERRKV